jgi:hypothetical protein
MRLGLTRQFGVWLILQLSITPLASSAQNNEAEPGLWLEMALLACAHGEREEAERLFRHIETHFSPPPGIQALIDQARSRMCAQTPRLRLYWSAGLAWSSNVNQAASSPSLRLNEYLPALELADVRPPLSDTQALLEADGRMRTSYGEAGVIAQFRHNRHHHAFDEDILGLLWRWPGPQTIGLNTMLSRIRTWLGGKPYADHLGLQASWSMPGWTAQLRWQASDYAAAPAFSAQVFSIAASRQWETVSGQTAVKLGALWDRAEGQRPGGDRHGGFAEMRLRYPGPARSRIELAGLYDLRLSEQAYLPGLLDIRRRQRTLRAEMGLSWPEGRDGAWRVGFTWVEVQDNVPFLAYRQAVFGVQWIQASFF